MISDNTLTIDCNRVVKAANESTPKWPRSEFLIENKNTTIECCLNFLWAEPRSEIDDHDLDTRAELWPCT